MIAGAGAAAVYGMTYVVSPDTLLRFNLNSLLTQPVLIAPPVIAGAGVMMPKFIKKPSLGKSSGESGSGKATASADQTSSTLVQPALQPEAGGNLLQTNPAPTGGATQRATSPAPPDAVAPTTTSTGTGSVQGGETKVSEIVEKKLAPVSDELNTMKSEFASFRKDIDELKGGVREITSSFENSLVELKAFQAEMVNPINFMRKYFETMDIKSLSDPTNVIKTIEQANAAPGAEQHENIATPAPAAEQAPTKKQQAEIHEKIAASVRMSPSGNNLDRNENDNSDGYADDPEYPRENRVRDYYSDQRGAMGRADDQYYDERDFAGRTDYDRKFQRDYPAQNPPRQSLNKRPHSDEFPFGNSRQANRGFHSSGRVPDYAPQDLIKSSIERGLTPGKIMSIVGIVDEVLATMGPDGVDLIVEQYRNMGLQPEEERLIYGVLKMLNESKILTDDIIAMLYRFGQVLGINDEEAELQYTRLIANRRNRKAMAGRSGKLGERAA